MSVVEVEPHPNQLPGAGGFDVVYGNPSVVHLSQTTDGVPRGWLLLLSRIRYPSNDTVGFAGGASDSLSDIVGVLGARGLSALRSRRFRRRVRE